MTEQEEALAALERAGVPMQLMGQPPRNGLSTRECLEKLGIEAPPDDPATRRRLAEAKVLQHLSEAGAAYAELGTDQEALDKFNLDLTKFKRRLCGGEVEAVDTATVKVGRKQVFLVMPHLGQVELAMTHAAFVCASKDNLGVMVADKCSSLLAFGFNLGWCDCLNHGKADYFCLLHSDIYPHEAWLDTLVMELEGGGFDALHAAVAIKDGRGLTSTAVGRVDDEWAKVRRVTVKELLKMPETFDYTNFCNIADWNGEEQLRGWTPNNVCMLPNTGVLLVKLGDWARSFPGFTIKDRLVYVTKDCEVYPTGTHDGDLMTKAGGGHFAAQVIPEDWGFGRWCAQNGLRVGCTRKVKTDHVGRALYHNHVEWGQWDRDEYFMDHKNV